MQDAVMAGAPIFDSSIPLLQLARKARTRLKPASSRHGGITQELKRLIATLRESQSVVIKEPDTACAENEVCGARKRCAAVLHDIVAFLEQPTKSEAGPGAVQSHSKRSRSDSLEIDLLCGRLRLVTTTLQAQAAVGEQARTEETPETVVGPTEGLVEGGARALIESSSLQGQTYGNTTLSDNATALLGNHYQYQSNFQINAATFVSRNDSTAAPYSATSRLKERIYNLLSDCTVDDDLAEWLAPDDYINHQNDTFAGVQQGTGAWFLQSDEYRSWMERPGHSLVLSGIPGAGKTCLASIIVDDLRNLFANDTSILILYFYNSFRREHGQTATAIISCLLRQAFLQNPGAGRPVHDLYEEHLKKGRRSEPSLTELLDALGAMLNVCSRSFLVFDALDECSVIGEDYRGERNLIMEALSSLQRESRTSILLTTRPTQDDLTMLDNVTRLMVRANDKDIAAYVALRLDKSKKDMFRKAEFREKVQSKILESAQGILPHVEQLHRFLLAKLQVDAVLAQTKRTMVQRVIESISHAADTLQTAYHDTLERIKRTPLSDLAGRALTCVVFSQRTLTLDEVRHALGIEIGMDDIGDDDLDDVQDLLGSCAGLLVLDEEGQTLRVVHETTQSFFEGLSDPWFTQYRGFLANACALYLSMEGVVEDLLKGVGSVKSLIAHAQTSYPFFSYALHYWFQHLRSRLDDEKLLWTALQALKHDAIIKLAMSEVGPSSRSTSLAPLPKWKLGHGGNWMHLLAWLGLDELLVLGTRHAAAENGSLHYDLEVKDPAISARQKFIVARSEDEYNNCPMVYASAAGNLALTEKLHGWSKHTIGTWNNQLKRSMYQAVCHDQHHIASWIIAHVEGLPMPDEQDYAEILDAAIQKRSSVMCAALLRIKNSRASVLRHSLFTRAGSVGCIEIIDMLLTECGHDHDRGAWSILTAAASALGSDPSRLDIVKHVLQRPSGDGIHSKVISCSLLHIACSYGFMPLYDHLLTYSGIDFDGRDEDGWTPLMRACAGAGINSMTNAAARDLLTSLCEKSTVNYQNTRDGCTAMHYAAQRAGQRDNKIHLITDVLRRHGAKDSIRNHEGETATDICKEALKGPEALEAMREEIWEAAREADKERWRKRNIDKVWKSRLLVEDSGESETDDEDYQIRIQKINEEAAEKSSPRKAERRLYGQTGLPHLSTHQVAKAATSFVRADAADQYYGGNKKRRWSD